MFSELKKLIGFHLILKLSGSETIEGLLCEVQSDYIILIDNKGIKMNIPISGILEINRNSKLLNIRMSMKEKFKTYDSFYGLLSSLVGHWLYVKRTNLDELEGILIQLNKDHVIIIFNESVLYVPINTMTLVQEISSQALEESTDADEISSKQTNDQNEDSGTQNKEEISYFNKEDCQLNNEEVIEDTIKLQEFIDLDLKTEECKETNLAIETKQQEYVPDLECYDLDETETSEVIVNDALEETAEDETLNLSLESSFDENDIQLESNLDYFEDQDLDEEFEIVETVRETTDLSQSERRDCSETDALNIGEPLLDIDKIKIEDNQESIQTTPKKTKQKNLLAILDLSKAYRKGYVADLSLQSTNSQRLDSISLIECTPNIDELNGEEYITDLFSDLTGEDWLITLNDPDKCTLYLRTKEV